MENTLIYQEPTFQAAAVPIEVAARVLGVDKQTVRIWLQNGFVEWGKAFKMPGSKQFTYLIYPRLFWLSTGYAYQQGNEVES